MGLLHTLLLVVLFGGNPVNFTLDQVNDISVRTGWYNGAVIRYFPIAASDAKVAKELEFFSTFGDDFTPVDFVPALNCAFTKDVLNDVYFINSMQTAVFSTEPGQDNYTPLWRVHVLEWARGAVKTRLTSQADVEAAIADNRLIQIAPLSVLDATIVVDSNRKVLKQAKFKIEPGEPAGEISVPIIKVFFTQKNQQPHANVAFILLTDSSDLGVAERIGANYAPRLANAAPDCCNPIYAFVNPVPPGQFPIIDQVQQYRPFDYLQINRNFNPLKCWTLFDRGSLPPSAIITNIPYADKLAKLDVISPVNYGPVVTNSTVFFPEVVY